MARQIRAAGPGVTGPAGRDAGRSALGAVVDELAAVLVAIDAGAVVPLFDELAYDGTGDAAHGSTDGRPGEAAGGGATHGCTDQRAAGGGLFSGGAGGKGERSQYGRDDEHDGFHWSLRDRFMVGMFNVS